jgi:hypothetical protein
VRRETTLPSLLSFPVENSALVSVPVLAFLLLSFGCPGPGADDDDAVADDDDAVVDDDDAVADDDDAVADDDDSSGDDDDDSPGAVYPLYFTTMTHMEGGHSDDTNEGVFNSHVAQLRDALGLASAHGAKMTVESELPFATGCVTWGINMMQEILDSGHGVGTHCDISNIWADETTHGEYVAELQEKKAAVDALVGAENNLGCSGAGGGTLDWVGGMADAGFSYINATVAMHYLSMPPEAWPDPTWTQQYIMSVLNHSPAPLDLYDRIYLRQLDDSLDFDHDLGGRLVLSSGSLGRPDQQAGDTEDPQFTNEDVDALVVTLREVHAQRDPSRVAKIEVHLSLEHLRAPTWDVLTYFFEELERLQSEGVVEWATQAEVFQAYVDSLP